jgi:hypothetical protein
VKFNPESDPKVVALVEISTVAGEQTAKGFVTIKLGNSFTVNKKSTAQLVMFL